MFMSCSYELVCDSCGYRDVFRFGLGFLYNWDMLFDFHEENELLERLVITKTNYETIKDLINNRHAMVSSDYGHDIYYCRCCGTFHEGFYIHLDYSDGEFEPLYFCNVCGIQLERTEFEEEDICHRWHLDMQHEKYPCPMCGELSLKRDFSL
jgi:hypothetical protein